MTIPIVLPRKMAPQRLTVGHRDPAIYGVVLN
jgi:hypothetical protein